jgi:perosamine synthetase
MKRYTFYAGTVTRKEIWAVVRAFLTLKPFVAGGEIKKFERAFAEYVGVDQAFSFGAGRMALYAILEALGIGAGDEVILPAYTCVVVPNAIIYRGAKPVYVDIDRQTLNIDVNKIAAKITPKTRAIMAQHTFGLPCDMDAIMAVAREHKLAVIEDCCLALGAEYKGRKVGTFGTASFFSFDSTKVINTELGGLAATADPLLAAKIRTSQSHAPFFTKGVVLRLALQYLLSAFVYLPKFYYLGRYFMALWDRSPFAFLLTDENMLKKPTEYPYPARLSNLQAMIGLEQLKQIEKNLEHRINTAREYERIFNGYPVELVNRAPNNDYKHIYLRFTFLLDDRLAWAAKYDKKIETGTWFDSIAHGRHERLEEIGYLPGSCPVGEATAKRNINLPTHLRVKGIEKIFSKGVRS